MLYDKLIHFVAEKRLPDESAFDTLERILLEEALEMSRGIQQDAAELLHTTPRVMNYRLARRRMRPIDKENQYGCLREGGSETAQERRTP